MKQAFTLAEVLITLAIIGIVAAITIPALITNYQKKTTAVRVKKIYAEMIQAVRLSEIDNGSMSTWDLGSTRSVDNTREKFAKYILPYLNGIRECSTSHGEGCGFTASVFGVNYTLNNGLSLSTVCGGNYLYPMTFAITVNRKENYVNGRDYFLFAVKDGNVIPYGWSADLTREELLGDGIIFTDTETMNLACKSSSRKNLASGINDRYRHGCTALLYLDNWEFKEDYPW